MMMGMKREGLYFLSRILHSGSARAYGIKKMVKVALYWAVLKFNSLARPAIFALPILVRSRNANKYRRQSYQSGQ